MRHVGGRMPLRLHGETLSPPIGRKPLHSAPSIEQVAPADAALCALSFPLTHSVTRSLRNLVTRLHTLSQPGDALQVIAGYCARALCRDRAESRRHQPALSRRLSGC